MPWRIPVAVVSNAATRLPVSVLPGSSCLIAPVVVALPPATAVTSSDEAGAAAVFVMLSARCWTAPTWAFGNRIELGVFSPAMAGAATVSFIVSVMAGSAAE